MLGDRLLERRWAGIAPARLPSPIGPPRTQSLARAPPFVARSALTASHRAFNSQETFALSASRATCWTSCIDPRPQARKIEAFQQAQRSFHPTSRDQRCVMLNLFHATPLVRAYWARVCDPRMCLEWWVPQRVLSRLRATPVHVKSTNATPHGSEGTLYPCSLHNIRAARTPSTLFAPVRARITLDDHGR